MSKNNPPLTRGARRLLREFELRIENRIRNVAAPIVLDECRIEIIKGEIQKAIESALTHRQNARKG